MNILELMAAIVTGYYTIGTIKAWDIIFKETCGFTEATEHWHRPVIAGIGIGYFVIKLMSIIGTDRITDILTYKII